MAQDPNVTAGSASEEATVHAHDYVRFTKLLKWTAIVVAILVVILLMIIK